MLGAFIFLCLQVIAVCVISVYAKKNHKHWDRVDTYLALALAILLAVFNVIYLAFLFVKVAHCTRPVIALQDISDTFNIIQ